MAGKRKIALLGSTGSIGCQTLEVIEAFPEQFSIEVLTAGSNEKLLIEQALKFNPNVVVINDDDKYNNVSKALSGTDIKVYAGTKAIEQVVEMDSIDMVLVAMVGFSGLLPVVNALKAGRAVALATKEVMVVAGSLVNKIAEENRALILPVDSEHSAIMQCLAGEDPASVEKVILTASGGPFRDYSIDRLKDVTLADALDHPNWNMGNKITIDSATMMNKGFEAIEAKWFFGLRDDQIDVLVHPQSIVHSMVQFNDGSLKAQMGVPDMKLPILHAMAFPKRMHTDFSRLDFNIISELTFEKPDNKKFRNLALAFEAMHRGGNMPCILNAANEVVVETFLSGGMSFLHMPDIIEDVMNKSAFLPAPGLDDLCTCDAETRIITKELISRGL